MRTFDDLVLNSNSLFFLNALLWFSVGFVGVSALVCVTALASLLYHRYAERNEFLHTLDQICAYFTLCTTLFVSAPFLNAVGVVILFFSLGFGLLFKITAHSSEQYDGWHCAWHMCVFFGQMTLALSVDSKLL